MFEGAVRGVAGQFASYCRDEQAVPTGQLVSLAQTVLAGAMHLAFSPRHLFIDEFQDTDAMQMSLLLRVAELSSAPLFVVGDAKQGIYRFRGAEGDAFVELRSRMGRDAYIEMTLSKNWRSGKTLLDSLHPFFTSWGSRDLLVYDSARDRLEAGRPTDESSPVDVIREKDWKRSLLRTVRSWTANGKDDKIAILCRENYRAREAQQYLRDHELNCDVLVGGDFFRSPAVREALAFLRAVSDPDDDAAVLQTAESRWAALADRALSSTMFTLDEHDLWESTAVEMIPWQARAASLQSSRQL